jgi:hypothetical protein
MSKPNHRPKVLPDTVEVRTTVPLATAAAIDVLVTLTGTNKATILRDLIHAGLARFDLVSPETAALPTTTYKKES